MTKVKTDRIEAALEDYSGERCEEYMPGCPCCDTWAQWDTILEALARCETYETEKEK